MSAKCINVNYVYINELHKKMKYFCFVSSIREKYLFPLHFKVSVLQIIILQGFQM